MKKILGPILSVLVLICSATAASAATVQLTWAPNSEPDVAGYIVFYGTSSRQYVASIDVGNQTSLQFVEPDPTVRYYLAVRAYTVSGLQSDFSAEVSTDEPVAVDSTGVEAGTRIDADKPAPQPAGSQIVFTATVPGDRSYKYKWWVFDGVEWSIAKEWSSSNTFTWKPVAANANYQVLVRVQRGSGRSLASAGTTMAFPIKRKRLSRAPGKSTDANQKASLHTPLATTVSAGEHDVASLP